MGRDESVLLRGRIAPQLRHLDGWYSAWRLPPPQSQATAPRVAVGTITSVGLAVPTKLLKVIIISPLLIDTEMMLLPEIAVLLTSPAAELLAGRRPSAESYSVIADFA